MNGLLAQFGGATEPVSPALGLLAEASLKAALILACALVATSMLRRASAATRHLVWSATIGAALLLPLAGAALPAWRMPMPVPVPPVAREAAGDGGAVEARGEAIGDVGSSAALRLRSAPPGSATEDGAGPAGLAATVGSPGPDDGEAVRSGAGIGRTAGAAGTTAAGAGGDGSVSPSSAGAAGARRWGLIALLIWAAGAAVVAAGVLVGLIRVRRLAGRALVVSDDRIASRVREIGERLGLRDTPRVLRGDGSAMPMTWGIARSVVFLPAEADEWSDERLDAVLLHKLAHVRRRDYLVQLAADLACALYWFDPLAWLAARRLRIEREHACDDQVLFAGARPSTYAGELLELARSLRPAKATAFAAMSMARPSQLTGRLLAVLDERRPRRVVSRRLAWSIAFAAGALLLPLAALTPAARGEAPEDGVVAASAPDAAREEAGGVPAESSPAAAGEEGEAREAAPTRRLEPERGRAAGPGEMRLIVTGATPCWDDDPHQVGIHSDGDGDVRTIVWRADDCELEARIEGGVRFRGDLTGLASITAGGLFRLEEDDGRTRRRIEVRPGTAGELVYEWSVDGDRRPFDAAARAWFREALRALLHRTGYAAEERVAWLLARNGVDGVLEEVDRIPSDFVRHRYLTELLRQADPDAAALVRVIARAGVRLDSDFELARLLIQIAGERTFTDELRQAFIEAAGSIGSDFERARVLTAALRKGGLTERNVVALIDAARDIESDFEQARLLIAIGEKYALSPEVQQAYLRAARDIGSDFEQRRVLDALLEQDGLTAASIAGILDASRELGSDFELARLLRKTARLDLGSPAVRRAYLTAAGSIGSDFELKRVLLALIEENDLDDELLRSVLETAAAIDSDFELASLLVAVAGRHRIDGEVREAFLRAADTIDSGFEHGRVASALLRQERGGT